MSKIKILVLLSLFTFLKKSIAQDWANLAKYKSANEKLLVKPSDEKRVVFMGNSITEGWTASFFENPSYINRGIGGQTTPQMVIRFRQDVIQLNPKMVLILAGTNDIAGNTGPMTLEQIRDNIASMVELAEANGICPVICSVLPAYDYPWKPGLNPNIKIPKLNKLLEQLANEKGVFYLDYFSEMVDDRNGLPSKLTYDEVHLTEAGYQVLSELAEIGIEKALKK